jgi:hypothetical protein
MTGSAVADSVAREFIRKAVPVAAWPLLGRERELAEVADFARACTAESGPGMSASVSSAAAARAAGAAANAKKNASPWVSTSTPS